MRGFNYKKAVQALNYFASKSGGTMNKMKAIKLIWLSDRLNLRQYGRTITGDEYYALPNGPVPSATRDILESTDFIDDSASDYGNAYLAQVDKYNYKSVSNANQKVFSKTDLQTIETIYAKYGHLDHFVLSELSHKFPEWKRHESALSKKLSSRYPISQTDFFLNIDDGTGLFLEPQSDLEITMAMFQANSKLLSAFQ